MKEGDRIVWTARPSGERFNGRFIKMSAKGRAEIEVWIPDPPPLRSGRTHRTWVKVENVEKQT